MSKSDARNGRSNRPDIRFDRRRDVRVQHHSAKGEVVRNVGSFTRGTQLVRLEYMMVWQGMKVPLIAALGCFIVLLIGTMLIYLHEHETQLVLMHMLATFWSWCDLNPMKDVNLTLPSGMVVTTTMSSVPYNPFVIDAWTLFTHCILASAFGAAAFSIPITLWFTNLAHDRGTDILKERHERGAMLVEPDVLVAEIGAYNASKLRAEAKRRTPKIDPEKVLRASTATLIKHGFHVPYKIAGIAYPFDLERTHGMLIGTTGTGKTTILLRMIEQARERGHRCVIFDLTGVFVQHFYDAKRDFILNPIDERCPPWSVFSDCDNILEFSSAANALFPAPNEGGDPFWTMSARTLFTEMCVSLYKRKERTNAALAHHLMYAELKELHRAMSGTIAAPLASTDSARMAESIRAVVNNQAQILRYLPDVGPDKPREFSIRKWVAEDKKDGSILFITSNHTHLNVTKPLLSLWMDMAVNAVLETERNAGLKIWFLFDEVHALQRLPALENGLQTARAYGGAFLLGIHSFERLCETYGKEGGTNLAALARTKVILTAADRLTAEFCSSQIGNREVREVDEAYSIGAAMSRDAATITPRTEVKPLILPDDIMNFPSMYGVIKFPEGFPAARIHLTYKAFPIIAEPFVDKKELVPTTYRVPANDVDGDIDGESGREREEGKENDQGKQLDEQHDTSQNRTQQAIDIAAQQASQQIPDQPVTLIQPVQAREVTANLFIKLRNSPTDSVEMTARGPNQQREDNTPPSAPKPVQVRDVAQSEMTSGVSTVDEEKREEHHHGHDLTPSPERSRDDRGYGE